MSFPPIPSLEQLRSISFWQELSTGLSLSAEPQPTKPRTPTQQELERARQTLVVDGYLSLDQVFATDVMERLAQGVQRVIERVGHPVWSLVYDDLWSLLLGCSPFVEMWLGEDAVVLPDIWAWCLHPAQEQEGWRPHRDRERGTALPQEMPRLLTFWLPLTDATPDNGCMYLLPASWDSRYQAYGAPEENSSLSLQNIRALPARAGSILAWSAHLLHWGGRASQWASHPRISVAFEIQSRQLSAPHLAMPLGVPAFSTRLGLVARQLLQYRHMEALPSAWIKHCESLMQEYLPKKRAFRDVLAGLLGR